MRVAIRLLAVFLASCLIRQLLILFFHGPGFWGDSYADSSFVPYRFMVGVSPRYYQTHLLSTFYYIGVYKLIGYSETAAQLANVFVYCLSIAIFYRSFEIIFNTRTALYLLALCSITYPFLFHSIWPVCFGLSPLGPALTMYFLASDKTRLKMLIFGLFCPLTILIYPGATICSIALILAYVLVFCDNIKVQRIGVFLLGLVVSILPIVLIRLKIHTGRLAEWGGGQFTINNYFYNLRTLVEDLFIRSSSWDSLNSEASFISWAALPFLFYSLYLAIKRPSSNISSRDTRSWLQVLFLAGIISVLIAAPTGNYPGIRRCYPVIFFFYGAVAYGISALWLKRRAFTTVLALFLLGANTAHTTKQIVNGDFDLRSEPIFYPALEKISQLFIRRIQVNASTVVLDLAQGQRDLFSEGISSKLGWRFIDSGVAVYSAASCQSFAELSSPVLIFSDLFSKGSNTVKRRIEICARKDCALSAEVCPVDESDQIYFMLANCSNRRDNEPPSLTCPTL